MALPANWAYAFTCDLTPADLRAALARAGPWDWSLRDPDGGDLYLRTLPFGTVVTIRVHVQDPPVDVGGGRQTYAGELRHAGKLSAANARYSAQLCGGKLSAEERERMDAAFRAALGHAGARDVRPFPEPYTHQ